MLTIEDYSSGKIFDYMKKIDLGIKLLKIPIIKNTVRKNLAKRSEEHRGDFIIAGHEVIKNLINSARIVAVGPRICYHLYKKDMSYGIFLDDLAQSLIEQGYAKKISKNDAIEVMKKEKRRPQMISRVSGKPLELCNQSLETCCLWKLEKAGIKTLDRY